MNYQLFKKGLLPGIAVTLASLGLPAQSLHITTGCNLVLTGSVNLVLNNTGFVNDGNFTAGNSTVQFTGNAGASIGGTAMSSFNNVVISKSSADIGLNSAITVNGNITMNGGNLQLNVQSLGLGSTGNIIGETELSHITSTSTGYISVTRSFAPNVAQNPGNIGAELMVNTTGSFTILRQHLPVFLPVGETSIQRSFSITGPSTPVFSLRFFYLDGELNGNNEDLVTLWSANIPKTPLVMQAKSGNDPNANSVLLSSITLPNQYGRFTLANDPTGGGLPGGDSRITNKPNTVTAETSAIINSARVYPNPVHDNFILHLVSSEPQEMTIGLLDQSGAIVQQKAIHCAAGTNTITWELGNVAAGVYYLRFSNPSFKNIQVIKQ